MSKSSQRAPRRGTASTSSSSESERTSPSPPPRPSKSKHKNERGGPDDESRSTSQKRKRGSYHCSVCGPFSKHAKPRHKVEIERLFTAAERGTNALESCVQSGIIEHFADSPAEGRRWLTIMREPAVGHPNATAWTSLPKEKMLAYCPGRIYVALLRNHFEAVKDHQLGAEEVFHWALLIANCEEPGPTDAFSKPPVLRLLRKKVKEEGPEENNNNDNNDDEGGGGDTKVHQEHRHKKKDESGENLVKLKAKAEPKKKKRGFDYENPSLSVVRQASALSLSSTSLAPFQVVVPVAAHEYLMHEVIRLMKDRPWEKQFKQETDEEEKPAPGLAAGKEKLHSDAVADTAKNA